MKKPDVDVFGHTITPSQAARADAVSKFALELEADLARERCARRFNAAARDKNTTFSELFRLCDLED